MSNAKPWSEEMRERLTALLNGSKRWRSMQSSEEVREHMEQLVTDLCQLLTLTFAELRRLEKRVAALEARPKLAAVKPPKGDKT